MDLDKMSQQWQEEGLPVVLDAEMQDKIGAFDERLQRENIHLTYWLTGTIYLTGIAVVPFLETTSTMFALTGIWVLMGVQAILFWARQMRSRSSLFDSPKAFVSAKLFSLKYNLLVTNVFMPIYVLLLGALSTFYLSAILVDVSKILLLLVVGFTWMGFILCFWIVWRRQREQDQYVIVPQIEALAHMQEELGTLNN